MRVGIVGAVVGLSLIGLALPGCEPGEQDPTGPEQDRSVEDTATEGTIELASGRSYVLDPGQEPAQGAPLVVGLHGLGGDAEGFPGFTGLPELHDDGAVLAYGDGLENSWNAGECCGPARDDGVDDVAYLTELVADAQRRIDEIDGERVYVVGYSNGAMMALRAACDRPDVFAGAAGVGGSLASPCAAETPVRYLHIHGTADEAVPYGGGDVAWLDARFPPIEALPERITATAPRSEVEVHTHGCGHVWPDGNDCEVEALSTMWEFLAGSDS